MLRVLVIVLVIVNMVLLSIGMGWIGRGNGGESERMTRQIAADKVRILSDRALASASVASASASAAAQASATEASVAASGMSVASAGAAASVPPAPAASVAAASVPAPAKPAPVAAAPAPAPAVKPAPPPQPKPQPQVCKHVPALPMNLADKAAAILKGHASVQVETKDTPASVPSYWVHVPPQKNRPAADARAEELRAKGVQDLFIVKEEGPNRFAISLGLYRSEKAANDYLEQLKKKGLTQVAIAVRGGEAKRDFSLKGPQDAVEAAIGKVGAGLGGELRTTACP